MARRIATLQAGTGWAERAWTGAAQRAWLLAAAGAAALILAARLHVVAQCAAALPFWDEWDMDLMSVFLPPASGRPGLAALFAAHNEHRIVLTRLFDLALFWLQGRQFHVLTGMAINQAVFSAFGAALLITLGRGLGVAARGALLLAGAGVWANPFGWQAITWSFESQIYFCIMLTVAAFALVAKSAPDRPAFWCGIGAACLSVISFGAGIAGVATVGLLVAARHLPGAQWRRAAVAIAVLAAVLVAGILATPRGNDLHLTHSLRQMAGTALAVLAWPRGPHWPAFIYWPAAFVITAGARQRTARSGFFWFVLAIAVWQAALAAQIAISRFDDPISSRYTELLIVGIVVNLACVLHAGARLAGARRLVWGVLALAWLAFLAAGFAHRLPVLASDIAAKRGNSQGETFDVARYLKTGDMAFIRPPAPIPYHTPDVLAAELRTGSQIGLFPPALRDGDTPKGGKWRKNWTRVAEATALAGLGLLVLAGLAARRQASLR